MVNEPRKREGHQLLIRFPEGSDIRERLDVLAKANSRSLSAEIIHRLDMSLRVEVSAGAASPDAPVLFKRVDTLEQELIELRKDHDTLYHEVRRLAHKLPPD